MQVVHRHLPETGSELESVDVAELVQVRLTIFRLSNSVAMREGAMLPLRCC